MARNKNKKAKAASDKLPYQDKLQDSKVRNHNTEGKSDEGVKLLTNALSVFGFHYGKEADNLTKWQQLCVDCGIQRESSITKCKHKALKAVNVNIWDLIRARETNTLPPRQFVTRKALRQDLYTPGRRFPLRQLKGDRENKFLRALLITL